MFISFLENKSLKIYEPLIGVVQLPFTMIIFGGRSMRRGGGGGGSISSSATSVRKTKTTSSGLDVYTGPHHPPSSTLTPKRNSSIPLSLSSSSSSSQYQNNHIPILHPFFTHSQTTSDDDDDSDWVSVDDDDDADSSAGCFSGRFIGSVPSEIEVDYAVSSLQRVLGPASRIQLFQDSELDHAGQVSKDDPETDWVEPSMSPYNSMILQANGSDRVYDAIHLLQTDPSVQRLVKSLSTDEAVWDAVLNNEVVQELRELISSDLRSLDEIGNNDPHDTTNVLMWILNTASARFMVVIDKITQFVINLFQHAFNKTTSFTEDSGPFNEKLRTSFMLSIIVLLIVVVSRVHR